MLVVGGALKMCNAFISSQVLTPIEPVNIFWPFIFFVVLCFYVNLNNLSCSIYYLLLVLLFLMLDLASKTDFKE